MVVVVEVMAVQEADHCQIVIVEEVLPALQQDCLRVHVSQREEAAVPKLAVARSRAEPVVAKCGAVEQHVAAVVVKVFAAVNRVQRHLRQRSQLLRAMVAEARAMVGAIVAVVLMGGEPIHLPRNQLRHQVLRPVHRRVHHPRIVVVTVVAVEIQAEEVVDKLFNNLETLMKNEFSNSLMKWLLLCLLVVSVGTVGLAQSSVDALRFSTPGLGVGARALSMGGAYTGVASDYSALFWNPAGLAQLEHGEFSFGLSHLNFKDQSSYFNLSKSQSNNSTALNSLGLVFPVPVTRGSLVFAFGYNRESNFTTGVALERMNIADGVAQDFARDRDTVFADELDDNLAWRLYLADTLAGSGHWVRFTTNGRRDSAYAYAWDSPLKNRLTQVEKALEGGGVNNWTVGGAFDVAKNISVGLALSYQSGTYKYEGNYSERDQQNVYTSTSATNPRNFNSLAIDDLVESELTGFSAKIGLLFRQPERYRIGFNVKTPTIYRVKETFSTTYTVTPDFGQVVSPEVEPSSNEYDVATPWVFSAGGSLILNELVLSGDVEYTDWTQIEFRNANRDLLALNKTFKDLFRATMNFRGGVEYNFVQAGLRARGGFIYNTSQYEGDPSSFDQKFITAGLGILLSESTMLDLTFVRGWWKTFRDDYRRLASINEDVTTNNVFATFSFRF